ncbi:hypothetical protein IC582_003848 [Cucumis melo]
MFISHDLISSSISFMLGNLKLPSSTCTSHWHLMSELNKSDIPSAYPITASCGILG